MSPCILASLEGDVNHCSVGWWVWHVQKEKEGFVFIIEGGLLLFTLIRSVCRRGNKPLPHRSSQGRVRGLCPPAFSDPWLISGAPWRDNCEPKPFWKTKQNKKTKKTKHKKSTQKGPNTSGAAAKFSQKTDQISPPKLETTGKSTPNLTSKAVEPPNLKSRVLNWRVEVRFSFDSRRAPSDRQNCQWQNGSWASQTERMQTHNETSSESTLGLLTAIRSNQNAEKEELKRVRVVFWWYYTFFQLFQWQLSFVCGQILQKNRVSLSYFMLKKITNKHAEFQEFHKSCQEIVCNIIPVSL